MRILGPIFLFSVFLAVACAGLETPEQIVFAAGKVEIAANKAVAEYKRLPLCGPMSTDLKLCSTQANAALADKALDAAAASIDSAEEVVRNPATKDGDVARTAAIAAQSAAAAALEIVDIIRR